MLRTACILTAGVNYSLTSHKHILQQLTPGLAEELFYSIVSEYLPYVLVRPM